MVVDYFPVLRKNWNREIFLAVYTGLSYLLGLTMVTRVGWNSTVFYCESYFFTDYNLFKTDGNELWLNIISLRLFLLGRHVHVPVI